MQVVAEDKGMVELLLGLDVVPVGEALQALLLVVVGEGQVQVGGVQLLVDLVVKQFVHTLIHDGASLALGSGFDARPRPDERSLANHSAFLGAPSTCRRNLNSTFTGRLPSGRIPAKVSLR